MTIFQRIPFLSTRLNRIPQTLTKIDRLAEPVFLLALAVWIVAFSWLRISGTSVGTYYQYLNGARPDPDLVFGQPRPIRGDEYGVATGWIAAQAQRDFPRYNDLYGLSGQALFFYDVPVKDFTLIFKPHFWAFLFLPLENAFAFKWWFRAALFILSLYLIFRRFTKGRILLSIGASLALFFSPFFQWWYSITLVDVITYYLLMFETFIRMVEYRRKAALYLYAALFAFFTITMVFFFYPPAMISVGWIFAILAGGYIWHRRELLRRERVYNYLLAGALSAALIGGFGLAFYLQYKTPIDLVSNTVYPGHRTDIRPPINLLNLLSGFFNIQLLQKGIVIPKIFRPNECEASGFFFFGVFLIPVMLFLLIWETRRNRRPEQRRLGQARLPFWSLLITLTFVIFLLWITNPPPLPVASLFFMSGVPAYRMTLAVGAINFVLVFWYLFGASIPDHKLYRWACAVLAGAVFLFYLGFGFYLKDNFPGFIVLPAKIVAIALFAGLAFYFLLQKRAGLFVTLLLVFSFLSSYSVNPLYRGLGEMTNGKLATMIREVNARDGGQSRWVFYDGMVSNVLQANGAKGLSGVFFYPDFPLYKVLDPAGESVDIYNRYAHVMYVPEYNDGPGFHLFSGDAFGVFIHPCSDVLRTLNVKYQVFKGQSDAGCLREVQHVEYPEGDYYIYEFK